jgi:MFS family permease
MPLDKNKVQFGWIVVVISFLTLLLICGIWTTFSVFIKPIQEEFKASRAEISMVASIGLVVSGASLILFGKIIDKYGPSKVIILSSILMGVSLSLLNYISTFSQYIVLFGFFAALGFAGAGLVANTALVRAWFQENGELALSITLSGLPFGTLVMTPIATQLILHYGWRKAYLALGLILLTLIPILFLFLIRSQRTNSHLESYTNNGNDGLVLESDTSIMKIALSPPFFFLLPVHFICGWTDIAIINHIVPHVVDSGFNEIFAAYVLSFIGGATWLGTLLFGFLSRRYGGQFLIKAIYFIRAMTFSLLIIKPNSAFLVLFSILFGLTQFSMVPLISSWIGDNYRAVFLGRLFALTAVIHSVGAALGTYLNGWIFDSAGSYNYAFVISAVLSLMASGICILIKDNISG